MNDCLVQNHVTRNGNGADAGTRPARVRNSGRGISYVRRDRPSAIERIDSLPAVPSPTF